MCNIKNALSRDDKERICGITEASEANIEGLEFRYAAAENQSRCGQRVYRDKDGNYYLAVWSKMSTMMWLSLETLYYLDGRAVLIPVRPEALAIWLHGRRCGKDIADHMRATEEFKLPKIIQHETVWTYQDGDIYEFLWKTDNDLYVLFSTDEDYPCPGYNAPYIEFNEDGTDNSRDDLYIYYVTPETARRWAEARGMGETACEKAFTR